MHLKIMHHSLEFVKRSRRQYTFVTFIFVLHYDNKEKYSAGVF